jgi:predicted anti-sigma-YlaC factor YlaD
MKKALFFVLTVINFQLLSCASNPAFVGKMLPGIIARDEKKLAQNPSDNDLILETGQYYISYANAFIQGPAEMLPPSQFAVRDREKLRAKEYYLKGVEILNTASNVDDDTAFLYWKAAGTLAAFSVDPLDVNQGLKLGSAISMLEHAYEIDPGWGNGTLDEMFFTLYSSLPGALGGDAKMAESAFKKAEEKSGGRHTGLYITYATSISVPNQNYTEFKAMLNKAIAINPSDDKDAALVNKINIKKAKYLLQNARYYFIEVD